MTDFKVINPYVITEEKIVSSNVLEDDADEWSNVITYARGDLVISLTTHTVYRSLTDSNLDNDPDQETLALADPLIEDPNPINWQVIGATNLFRLFDGKPSVRSTNPDEISVVISPGQLVQGVAVFEVNALDVNIRLSDPDLPRRNLLTYTEQFDNAAWIKEQATVSPNVATAPDGTETADKIIATSVSNVHQLALIADAFEIGDILTLSTFVKSDDYNRVRLQVNSAGATINATFSLLTGSVVISVNCIAAIEDFGNGWYRISIQFTMASNNTPALLIQLNNGSESFLGDDVSGMFFWGAQLETGPLTDYQRVITGVDDWDRTVYKRDVEMQDETAVIDGFSYFFSPIVQLTEFILTDIPPYLGGELELIFERPGAVVSVGQIVVGEIWTLGKSVIEGTGFTGLDFSFIDVDEFGNLTTAVRAATEKHDFEVWVDNVTLGSFKRRMKSLRGGKGAVWISTEDTRLAAFSYGFALAYRNVYTTRNQSMISIEVQGKV